MLSGSSPFPTPANEDMAPAMIVRRAPPPSLAENLQAQQEQEQQQ